MLHVATPIKQLFKTGWRKRLLRRIGWSELIPTKITGIKYKSICKK
jgi:hypothetical protein